MIRQSNTLKTKILAGVLALIACGVLSGGLYYWWLITPPPMPTTVDEAAQLITDPRFKRLSDDRKLAYISHMRKLVDALDEQQRRAMRDQYRNDQEVRDAMRDIGETVMVDMAREFVKAPPLQKQIVLDTLIGRMEQEKAAGHGPWGKPDQPLTEEQQQRREQARQEMIKQMEQRAATGNPQHAAYVGQFIKSFMKRRDQLGLPPLEPPSR